MTDFERGYKFFINNFEGIVGSDNADKYMAAVDSELDNFTKHLNSFEGFKTPNKMLKGDVMEFWHSDTFNIKAAIAGSRNRTTVDRSHDFASADITSNFKKDFGLKAYADGVSSAKAQATSVFQRYAEYKSIGGADNLEKFLNDRNIRLDLNDPIYSGQVRIIPRDQMVEAKNWLQRMIHIETSNRPEQAQRYKETLKLLDDRLRDNKGIESIPISKDEAEKLASLAKQGSIRTDDFGLITGELIKCKDVAREASKSGLTAATISMVLKVAPEIYKAFSYLIKNGEIEQEQFKAIGFAAISGGSEGFIRGAMASAITVFCRCGFFGDALENTPPSVLGAVTVLSVNALKNAYAVAVGKKTKKQLADDFARDIYISAFSLVCGGITQGIIDIPVFGYMVGSFVGSVIGSFAYGVSKKAVISFCVESGFTMFGLVKQDYTLPKEVINEIGIDTFDYESFDTENFQPESFDFDTFDLETFKPDSLNITFLRRGVIEVTKIGYV